MRGGRVGGYAGRATHMVSIFVDRDDAENASVNGINNWDATRWTPAWRTQQYIAPHFNELPMAVVYMRRTAQRTSW